ncbi:alkaline phosphatase [Caerostris extrusa]|uniref:alkaline phosphatase n=1 Tax=Caerostris extrusa TaxID=172846 RepID=A0AAV4UD77_CAEEX|nr:alkaline phosphatase [Caerostris extrusa]
MSFVPGLFLLGFCNGVDEKPSDVDNMPYTTLLYANGPGYNHNFPNGRENLTAVNTEDKNFIQQSAVPRRWDSHGGEDVPVYAHGPMAHLFRGVFEQTYVPCPGLRLLYRTPAG